MEKVTIIIPTMNEEQSISQVVKGVRQVMGEYGIDYEVLVIDDGSSDNTGVVAREAGARVIRHAYNMGNGAAVKTGIRNATGDVILMMDGDGQHDPADIPRLLAKIHLHGMVVGARMKGSQTDWYRNVANTVYNLLASYICGRSIPDLTSGFRAIHASLARQFVNLLPNTFSYPTTLTLAVVHEGHSVEYVPIMVARRIGKSKIKLIRDGSRFLMIIFKIATLFSPLKVFLPISLCTAGLGIAWYLLNLLAYGPRFPPASVVMILAGLLLFMMGLISEQIAQLRYDRGGNVCSYVELPRDTPSSECGEKP